MLSALMLGVIDVHCIDCRYAECRYTGFCGTLWQVLDLGERVYKLEGVIYPKKSFIPSFQGSLTKGKALYG
jgi:hypothetical protein